MFQLEIKNLNIFTDDKKILENVNLKINKGETIALLGKNGNGKTSIFKAIMNYYGFKKEGSIFFNGFDISNSKPNEIAKMGIWYIPQISVEIKGLKIFDFLKSIVADRENLDILDFYNEVEIKAKKLNLNPEILKRDLNYNFSGGEKKKLEILQLLLVNPELILIDEVDSGLDKNALKMVIDVLKKMQEKGKTIIIISHNLELLKQLHIEKCVLVDEGKIVVENKLENDNQIMDFWHDNLNK